MTTSSLLRHGVNHMGGLLDGLVRLLAAREFASVAEVRGRMSQKNLADLTALERANYIQVRFRSVADVAPRRFNVRSGHWSAALAINR
jgi:hypothetical protein